MSCTANSTMPISDSQEGTPTPLDLVADAARLTDALKARADLQPARVALVDGRSHLTYRELWIAIEEFSGRLRAHGIGPGAVVALRLPRGSQQIVAIAAVLAAGAAFVPIDPAYPTARQDYILADSSATVVVSSSDAGLDIENLTDVTADPVPIGTSYILYTSGSTGAPKGVIVAHDHVIALLRSCFALFDVGPNDSWTMFHSFSFDFSVWEMWGCLLSGGRLVIVAFDTAIDPIEFVALLAAEAISVVNAVPTVFRTFAEHAISDGTSLPRLRYLIFGGEAIEPAVINRWSESEVAPSCLFVNMYGITETTVHATFLLLDPPVVAENGTTPIGHPLDHLEIILVDDEMNPVLAGEIGEMMIGGASVATGYRGQPELTSERFVELADVRYYRSGDRAVRNDDGSFRYVGRADDQVKVRGFRIELSEVEAALVAHPWVDAAVCRAEIGDAGHTVLAAFVIASSENLNVTDRDIIASVRTHLRRQLPAHAIPSRLTLCDEFPRTPSGKIDRVRLPDRAGKS